MNLISIEDNKNNIIVKHKDLVLKARYRLSELGIKIMAVLISMIKVSDEDFKQYALNIDDFKELIESDSKNTYKYTHRVIQELLSKTLKIKDEQFSWVTYGKYVEGENTIILEVNRHLKPYLLRIQRDFIKYNIANILSLKSEYVIRLYELFKSKFTEYKHYNLNATSYTFELKISWLRKHFEIPKSYRYNDIKRNVINKAQKQFLKKTDIKFVYKEQKIGRKVDRLIITIRENAQNSNSHLNSLQSFISYLRANYVNKDIAETKDKYTEEKILLSVSECGELYNKYTTEKFNSKRALEIWKSLYKLAKENKLF